MNQYSTAIATAELNDSTLSMYVGPDKEAGNIHKMGLYRGGLEDVHAYLGTWFT